MEIVTVTLSLVVITLNLVVITLDRAITIINHLVVQIIQARVIQDLVQVIARHQALHFQEVVVVCHLGLAHLEVANLEGNM